MILGTVTRSQKTASNLTTITANVIEKLKVMRCHQEIYKDRQKSRAITIFALHSVALKHYQKQEALIFKPYIKGFWKAQSSVSLKNPIISPPRDAQVQRIG